MPIQMSAKSKDKLFNIIHDHIGHHIEATYHGGDYAPENVSIECLDCNSVIIDVDCEN